MTNIFQLHPMTDEPALPDREWLAQARADFMRPCGHWKQNGLGAIVLRSSGENAALTFVAGAPGSLIRDDLLKNLSPEFGAATTLSNVVGSQQSQLRLHAYWSDSPTDFRGNKRSYCYRCDGCGELSYTAMGETYLLEQDVPDSPLFVTQSGYIVIDESLLSRLETAELQKVEIIPVPILSKPRDGFPSNLQRLTREMERRPAFMS